MYAPAIRIPASMYVVVSARHSVTVSAPGTAFFPSFFPFPLTKCGLGCIQIRWVDADGGESSGGVVVVVDGAPFFGIR